MRRQRPLDHPTVAPCADCGRARIPLHSGAGYVCPAGHGKIVQPLTAQPTLPIGGSLFDTPYDDRDVLASFTSDDGTARQAAALP